MRSWPFSSFAALSTTWSAAPRLSLATLAEFGAALGGAFIVGLVLPRRMPQRRPLMLAASLGLACAAILLQLWTDLAIRRAVALRADDFIYNRPTLTVLVLTISLAWMLLRGGHRRTGWLVLAAAGATIVISSSGAAVLGALVALFCSPERLPRSPPIHPFAFVRSGRLPAIGSAHGSPRCG